MHTSLSTTTPCAITGIDDDDGGGRIMRLQISLGASKKEATATATATAATHIVNGIFGRRRYFQTTAD